MDTLIDIAELADDLRRVTVEVTDADELLGSGLLWPPGHVVTNAHVVRRPEVTLRLSDGRSLRARVRARDADADLALLSAPGSGVPGVSVAERRRSPPVPGEPTRSTTVLIVAGNELVAARVEAMLRSQTGLRVSVSAPSELARRLGDHAAAIVVLALESAETARLLEILRGMPKVDGVLLLALDPSGAWTAQ